MKCHFFHRTVQTLPYTVLWSLVRVSSILEIILLLPLSPCFSTCVCVFVKNSVNSLCVWRFPLSVPVCIIPFCFFSLFSRKSPTRSLIFFSSSVAFKRITISLILVCFCCKKKWLSVLSRKPIFVIFSFDFHPLPFLIFSSYWNERDFVFIFCTCHFQSQLHSRKYDLHCVLRVLVLQWYFQEARVKRHFELHKY